MLKIEPDNPSCLLNKGCFLVELGDYATAVKSFDQAANLVTNNYTAILYRGIANLRLEKFDDATKDYEFVQQQYPKLPQIFFGLGEIAYRRRDTNTAVRNYEGYLTNAPPQTAEAKLVGERLAELKGVKTEKPNSEKPK